MRDVESYMLRYNNDEGTITAYLKDDRKMSTDEVVSQWENRDGRPGKLYHHRRGFHLHEHDGTEPWL